MDVETTRFGTIQVADQDVITFTHPIIGFTAYRRFVFVPGPEGSSVRWLQSVDAPDLAFLLMNPTDVVPEYAVKLGETELTELAVDDVSELDIYTLVVVPQDPSQARTNLKAPLLINARQRLGKQTILERSDYPVRHVLAQSGRSPGEAQEVSNARADS